MKKWNKTKDVFKRQCHLAILSGWVFVVGGMTMAQAANPPSVTATYTVTTQAPTCNLQLNTPATLNLGDVRQTDFQTNSRPGTAQGQVITLQLTGCTGAAAPKLPKVSVYGDRDGVTDSTLYRKSTSEAAGVGFILTQDKTGAGTALNAGTQANPTKVQVPGTSAGVDPNNKTIDFFVQASRGMGAANLVTSGKLTTDLHFDFLYE